MAEQVVAKRKTAQKQLTDDEILQRLENCVLIDELGETPFDLCAGEMVKVISKSNGDYWWGVVSNVNRNGVLRIKKPGRRGVWFHKTIKPDEYFIYVDENKHEDKKEELEEEDIKNDLFIAYREGRLLEAQDKKEIQTIKKLLRLYKKGKLQLPQSK